MKTHPYRLAMHYQVEVHGLLRRVELPFVTAVLL